MHEDIICIVPQQASVKHEEKVRDQVDDVDGNPANKKHKTNANQQIFRSSHSQGILDICFLSSSLQVN